MGSLWLVRFSVPGYDEGAGGGPAASGVSKCLKFEYCVPLPRNFNTAMLPHTPELRRKFEIFLRSTPLTFSSAGPQITWHTCEMLWYMPFNTALRSVPTYYCTNGIAFRTIGEYCFECYSHPNFWGSSEICLQRMHAFSI